MRIEKRLAELGLELPEPIKLPPGVSLPFPWVRVWDNRAVRQKFQERQSAA